ncbi:MAG TPA: hypothetical protein VIY29_17360 [Ktedonobacteraceae bacterium]
MSDLLASWYLVSIIVPVAGLAWYWVNHREDQNLPITTCASNSSGPDTIGLLRNNVRT